MSAREIITLPDAESLARHAAAFILQQALAKQGDFTIALSGGSTPKRLYELLADPHITPDFPWERTHLFWGDERFVAPDSEESNYRMTRLAMLNFVPIPPEQIHPMPTHGNPKEAAYLYQTTLIAHYGSGTLDPAHPLFDVVLLGLGENGHTASLFPGTAALQEQQNWVAPVTEAVPQPRLTLTYPAIASSAHVVFLVSGAAKQAVLKRTLAGDPAEPASHITSAGMIHWFTDQTI